jgi:serine/threonine-protein kinase ATR
MNEVDQSMFSHESDGSPPTAFPNCTYVVRFASEGICHVANILCMLTDISTAAAASYDPTPAYQDYIAWLLDAFFAAHEQRKKVQTDPSFSESCRISDVTSFTSLHGLLSTSKTCLRATILRKGYTILSTLCADLIDTIGDLAEHAIQLNLCSSLLNLAAACKEDDSMKRAVSLRLVPAIQLVLNNGSKPSCVSKDFQVCPIHSLRCFVIFTKSNLESCFHIAPAIPTRNLKPTEPLV